MTENGIKLSEEQKKRQRARSIAIAFILVFLVVLFYVITVTKMGGMVFDRPV